MASTTKYINYETFNPLTQAIKPAYHSAMDIKDEIKLASRRIRASGTSVSTWCDENGIPRANWYRWEAGGDLSAYEWERVKGLIAMLPTIVPPEPSGDTP